MLEELPSIEQLIDAGALFVANYSGGKDSQAMLIKLLELISKGEKVLAR